MINLDRLAESFEGQSNITLEDIYARGLAKNGAAVKILGRGEISAALTIEAHKFTASALEKIQNAGGEAKALEG